MSRGPGRIQSAIESAFTPDFNDIYTLEDLVLLAYPGANRAEKKHRVAVARAARAACARKGWGCYRRAAKAGENVYFNLRDVRSYGLARIRCDFINNDMTTDDLRAYLDGRGDPRWVHRYTSVLEHMKPGAGWHEDVRCWQLELDGDEAQREEAGRIRARRQAEVAAFLTSLRGRTSTS